MNLAFQYPADNISQLPDALKANGFRGDVSRDSALRAAVSTDNSIYRIMPDLVVAPIDADDVVTLMTVMELSQFQAIPLTARGGGTGTNGQSLNSGVVIDLRRHMNRLLHVDPDAGWADVEPGIVLDELNAHLRPFGLFFAPETSTSNRCTVGGMVATDASGKGSRVYGKTSDNLIGIEIARGAGRLASFEAPPAWAEPMLDAAERAARAGKDAFIANTPRLNRRFTGYDLERACADADRFEWWRLFPGSEGTLGPITRLRLRLLPLPKHKRLVVAGFDSFRDALSAATPLLVDEPTAIEVMDERVQALARDAGLLARLPQGLQTSAGQPMAYTFIEFNGDDSDDLERRVAACCDRLPILSGLRTAHVAASPDEIAELWAIRSAGVGLLGRTKGRARPIAFVEDCVVPPENLPQFLDGFLAILERNALDFGIYGHVDVGCLHIRPALDIDQEQDRQKLSSISDDIFNLTTRHGGIFWGEHGKGVRGAYLERWIGPEAYRALQAVKSAFDPAGRYNPGKLVSTGAPVMGITDTPLRPFNAPEGDPLDLAFRCNGNAQCHSYAATTTMCPSFKATGDPRQSPKGRADTLRTWRQGKLTGTVSVDETDVLNSLDTCLGCRACASSCPVQVDIPTMRAAFLGDYYRHHRRPMADRMVLWGEMFSPWLKRLLPVGHLVWPLLRPMAQLALRLRDLPPRLASGRPAEARIGLAELSTRALPAGTVLIWQDWFSALFDADAPKDVQRGLSALGYKPLFVDMLPSGKAAHDLGDRAGFERAADRLVSALKVGADRGVPMVGLDPAFVMALRQDYAKAGKQVPEVLLVQEFLSREITQGVDWPRAEGQTVRVMTHCTETTGAPTARDDWQQVLERLALKPDMPKTGCCGMAGMFGHKARHQAVSQRLFAMSWAGVASSQTAVGCTGFSCRSQVERLTNKHSRHPLGIIADILEKT